jgi:hypothetical protein
MVLSWGGVVQYILFSMLNYRSLYGFYTRFGYSLTCWGTLLSRYDADDS